MSVVALVPARGGSQRVPGKNLRPLAGHPLVAHTIVCAARAGSIDRVICSTDDPATAEVARSYGAEAPFLRPAPISGSDATELQFLTHALEWLRDNEGAVPDLVVLLYPTSPFRRPESIDAAVELIGRHPGAHSLRSIRPVSEHPHKMWVRDGEMVRPFVSSERSDAHTLSYQLLPQVFIQNASIYVVRSSTVLELGSPTGTEIVGFPMDEMESIDVNTPLDLAVAECLVERGLAVPSASGGEVP